MPGLPSLSRSSMPEEYVFCEPTRHIEQVLTYPKVLIDGPSEDKALSIPRQAVPLAHVSLTSIVMKIPRAIGPGPLAKKWKEAGIEKQWKESAFAQGRARSTKRRTLNDFDRFKVMRLKKQVRGTFHFETVPFHQQMVYISHDVPFVLNCDGFEHLNSEFILTFEKVRNEVRKNLVKIKAS
jgi:large subunit ribosomal protein L14e